MATKKDLVEAYSFSRRRLVTAFVSGAPGGREVEPSRPGRTIVGGVALAVLLVAGALVLGIVRSPTNVDWDSEALIGEKGSGADYVNIVPAGGDEPELHPIINITSAMLLLGADIESTPVSAEEIATRPRQATIGILQAPSTPPPASSLLQTGWTACTTTAGGPEAGTRLRVSADDDVIETPATSAVVRTPDGALYLIAESELGWNRAAESRAYAYPVPDDDNATRLLQELARRGAEDATAVPADWITLFPPGRPLALATFGLDAAALGERSSVAGQSGVPGRARVGTVLESGETRYLLLPDGFLRLDDFSYAVYVNAYPGGGSPDTRKIPGAPTGGDLSDARSLPRAFWPTQVPPEQASGPLCAVLDAAPGSDPGVHLGRAEPGSPADAGGAVGVPAVAAGETEVQVDSGAGAFVGSGDWDALGPATLTLVDDRGVAFRVQGETEQANLGYADVAAEVVPSAWLGLFSRGVVLSVDAARCPPTSKDAGRPCTAG